MKGLVIGGEFNNILVREKADAKIELGEILVVDNQFLQVVDLEYGSQLSQQGLELASGLTLEGQDVILMDSNIRHYVLARMKNLVSMVDNKPVASKQLPTFFSEVRTLAKEDVSFLTLPQNPLVLGKLRSGSTVLDVPVGLDGGLALSHHILVCGSTGKGKSNLMRNLLWEAQDKDYCGMLILDPHDEYYGRTHHGLKDHTSKPAYYSKNAPPGAFTLTISTKTLQPHHFDGVVHWSDAQRQALQSFKYEYGDAWVTAALQGKELKAKFVEMTVGVVQRRLQQLLSIDSHLNARGCFDLQAGSTTINDMVRGIQEGKTVIVDTSEVSGPTELLIGSIVASALLHANKAKGFDELKEAPTASIVLEEAPRVLGKDAPPNVFSTIAREGRKFKVGLIAITQVPSLIPREILANMNTKIILGMESKIERQAVIDSAPQDLSTDERKIASFDKGEALVTSSFIPFPFPIKIPEFT